MVLASIPFSILTMDECVYMLAFVWVPIHGKTMHMETRKQSWVSSSAGMQSPPLSWGGGLSLARSSLVWIKCLAIEPQQSPHLCFLSAGIRGAPSQAWLFMWCWDQTQVLVLMRQACHLLSFHSATVYTSCLAYVSMCSVHVCAYAYVAGAHACTCTCAHGGIDADTENLPWLLSTLFTKPGPFS